MENALKWLVEAAGNSNLCYYFIVLLDFRIVAIGVFSGLWLSNIRELKSRKLEIGVRV